MAVSKLSVYNKALRAIGDLRLSSLTEDVEARYVLDDAWDDCVAIMFTEGLWNFATKTEQITYDPGFTPIPGFSFTFLKPENWVRTITISPNSLFTEEAVYRDENGKFYANWETLYIRYISSEKAADAQVPNWPQSFADAVSMCLAKDCGTRISGSAEKGEALKDAYKDALAAAKNKDAMDQAQVQFQPGNWIRAMRGSSVGRDRGPLSGY